MSWIWGNLSLLLLLAPVQESSGTYDFYLPSVKRGSATYNLQRDALKLSSTPGFAPSSRAELDFESGSLRRATFTPASGDEVDYAVGSDGTLSKASHQIGALPLYSPTHPYLLRYLLERYDLSKGGFQTIKAIDIAKGTTRDTQVELYRTQVRTLDGRHEPLREWRFVSPPTPEAIVWTGTDDIPLYWWVPAVNYEAVKRGCEELRPATRFDGKVSPPRFEATVDRNVWIPMRDGVRLQADVYRPNAAGRFPVIMQRSCYDRSEFGNADGEFYAQRGYVYVTEHVRGRGGSEGEFVPTLNEAADGYDTVKWCGEQPWSNGKVGMTGASYNGFCCWMAAKTHPKWLKTIISLVPMPGPPNGAFWDRGAAYPSTTLWWFGLLRDRAKVQPFTQDVTKAMNTLPLSKMPIVQYGKRPPGIDFGITSNTFDASLRKASYRFDMGKIDIPVLYFDGWLDPVALGTKLNYLAMVGNGRKNQKLIWGPWDHFTNQKSHVGKFDYGPDGYVDMRTTCLRWFDRFLKGRRNDIDKEPAVSDFVLNEGWRQEGQWPSKGMRVQRWYLQTGGRLTRLQPARTKPSTFIYDPAHYVYSNEDNSGYFGQIGDEAAYLCRQGGQILFDTKPLKRPLTLDGPIRGTLYASSSARDTDWVMVLIDRHPDGVCVPLATGFIRARYRKSITHPSLLKPGEIFKYRLDMWETGIRIPAGHQLRVVVCSTLFPDLDRNLNTGEPIFSATRIVAARQKIYHDRFHPSGIDLPVIRDG